MTRQLAAIDSEDELRRRYGLWMERLCLAVPEVIDCLEQNQAAWRKANAEREQNAELIAHGSVGASYPELMVLMVNPDARQAAEDAYFRCEHLARAYENATDDRRPRGTTRPR